ncbi:MAG: hypothetical protein KDA53_12755 [Hyphomonas sp.]|nr:hypothetical protein [Hyphomonas sp.]
MSDEERPQFLLWVESNVSHLKHLREQIVAGGTPDIDRTWPDPAGPHYVLPPVPAPSLDELASEKVLAGEATARQPTAVSASYTFDPAFLNDEGRDGEDLKQTDLRLLDEYELLELRRPLDGMEEARRLELRNNFLEIRE